MWLRGILARLPASRAPGARLAAGLALAAAMAALTAGALIEFRASGLARRTFVFYAIDSGDAVAEERMLRRAATREQDVARYVEEALLGPAAPGSRPLFPRGTALHSLLYRNGVVYADFSGEAAMPPLEGGDAFQSFETLRSGIKRNFPSVGEARFFIDGRAAFAGGPRR